ncbi:NADP-dependent oxidoreductase [Myxococcus sp. K15C18031901]|uniref:NADP-dependent oxidoreductase n=1 Tax=Myxococcus dinghuensis TaxID=2906761 RepID=UPI0020A8270E|nr:NADP-dependent oxidoreductase [Myxococcus dinghuensis]MCP3102859.1 NADP-dependent oxidoreductase [Myxococcus dinghuensis]
MKAIVMTGYGDVDTLELRDMPEPSVGPGDVKVRVKAASVNPIDWKIRKGSRQGFIPVRFPYVPGRDVSGEVVEVGRDVTRFKEGDQVMGLVNGGYAERVVAPAEAWAPVPRSLDTRDAAALPLVSLTGTQLMEEGVDPHKGDTVLVTGAMGSVGRAAVHAAKRRGAKVWAGVRRKQKSDAAQLGVDGVVAIDDPADLDSLPPLDAIADTVGGETTTRLLPRLKPGGTLGSVVGEPPGAKERGIQVRSILGHPDGKRLAQLGEDVARGELAIPIAKRFPLRDAREAQQTAERGGVNGKVLLTP